MSEKTFMILSVEADRGILEILYVDPDGVTCRNTVWIPENVESLNEYIKEKWPTEILEHIRNSTKRAPEFEKLLCKPQTLK